MRKVKAINKKSGAPVEMSESKWEKLSDAFKSKYKGVEFIEPTVVAKKKAAKKIEPKEEMEEKKD